MLIYKCTNLITTKAYIGQTTRTLSIRIQEYCKYSGGSETYFHNSLRKYGIENFHWEILYETDDLFTLNFMENYYIEKQNTLSPNGYNLTTGGLNKTPTLEVRQKMSESGKRKMFTKEHRLKLSEANRRRKVSPETRLKMSNSKIGKGVGRRHSPEAKLKMSLAKRTKLA